MGGWWGDWVENMKGLISTNWYKIVTTNVKYSIKNIANNVVITMYGARWELEISERTLCKIYNCLTSMCIPETNIKIISI